MKMGLTFGLLASTAMAAVAHGQTFAPFTEITSLPQARRGAVQVASQPLVAMPGYGMPTTAGYPTNAVRYAGAPTAGYSGVAPLPYNVAYAPQPLIPIGATPGTPQFPVTTFQPISPSPYAQPIMPGYGGCANCARPLGGPMPLGAAGGGGSVPLRPIVAFNGPPTNYVVGQGMLGQPKLYIPGQPVRNALRYLTY